MSTLNIRRELAAGIKAVHDSKLPSLLDFVRYLADQPDPDDEDADLYTPEMVRAIRRGEADYAAGRYVTLEELKRKLARKGSPRPAARKRLVRVGK